MKCHDARRLFGAYWDDETTKAEREWLEAHFAACTDCHREYEQLTRAIDAVGTLPRHEPAPDLLERTLARTRRATVAPDTLPERRVAWVPATAAVALMLIAAAVAVQLAGIRRVPGGDRSATLVQPVTSGSAVSTPSDPAMLANGTIATVPDSIFDHSDDVEFVLDPVTLRRGRATVTRPMPGGIQTEKAVVTF
jgi:anti-sigma factor RsiW